MGLCVFSWLKNGVQIGQKLRNANVHLHSTTPKLCKSNNHLGFKVGEEGFIPKYFMPLGSLSFLVFPILQFKFQPCGQLSSKVLIIKRFLWPSLDSLSLR